MMKYHCGNKVVKISAEKTAVLKIITANTSSALTASAKTLTLTSVLGLTLLNYGCVEKTPDKPTSQTLTSAAKTVANQPQAKPYPMIVTLTAGGFEPMWDTSITQIKEHVYQIILRFPEQTIKGKLELDDSYKSPSTGITRWQGLDDKQRPINIIHRKEPCINMAGDDSGSTLKIAWEGEVLKGCSSFTLNTTTQTSSSVALSTPSNIATAPTALSQS